MPSSFLIVGDDDFDFGTDNAGYSGIGVIKSASRKHGGDTLEIKDRKGNVVAVVFFNDKDECEIEVLFEAQTLPVRGDAIDVCGVVDVLVFDFEKKWEIGEVCLLIIRGTKFANITVA